MSTRQTAGAGTLPIVTMFIVIPLVILGVAVAFDGRPLRQEIVVTALSDGNPLGGIRVRILIDQGDTCDGNGYDVTANGRGVAEVTHAARLGFLEVRAQSVAVCLPDKEEWILAWSSHHGPAPARLAVACDAADTSAPRCDAKFEN
ncbi:MAG: hypothetical protein JRH16_16645 [Deltaproteobacteria bacterium]|nr:hypothetical protein [Deltaproteobacteria bacterium]